MITPGIKKGPVLRGRKKVGFPALLTLFLWALAAGSVGAQEPAASIPVENTGEPTVSEQDSTTVLQPSPGAVEIEQPDTWSTGVSPTGAVLMTPLFPGWGQLYADNSWRAALAFGAEMYFWSNMLTRDRRAVQAREFAATFPEGSADRNYYDNVAEENWEQMRDFAWWSGGALLIIALDAYVGAHLYNFDEDPIPVPDRWDDMFGYAGDSLPGLDPGPMVTVFRWRKTF